MILLLIMIIILTFIALSCHYRLVKQYKYYIFYQNDESYVINSYVKIMKITNPTIQHILFQPNYNNMQNQDNGVILFPNSNRIDFYYDDLIQNYSNLLNKTIHINGINNIDLIVSKSSLWKTIYLYYIGQRNSFELISKYLPMTYLLEQFDLDYFFQYKYRHNNDDGIYIFKKNIQNKKGLLLVNTAEEIETVIQTNQERSKNQYVILQKYITNVYCIQNYKLNLRVYLLVVSQNIKNQFYLFTNGKCIYTLKKYNRSNITNLDEHITNNTCYNQYKYLPHTLKDLNKLSPTIPIFDKLVELFQYILKPYTSILGNKLATNYKYQLLGCDIIFQQNLNSPILLEINKGPNMSSAVQWDKQLKQNVYQQMLYLTSNSNNYYEYQLLNWANNRDYFFLMNTK